jgi:membrane protein
VVLLIWLSWNVNAIFFGGALATEMEISFDMPALPLAGGRLVRLRRTSAR